MVWGILKGIQTEMQNIRLSNPITMIWTIYKVSLISSQKHRAIIKLLCGQKSFIIGTDHIINTVKNCHMYKLVNKKLQTNLPQKKVKTDFGR